MLATLRVEDNASRRSLDRLARRSASGLGKMSVAHFDRGAHHWDERLRVPECRTEPRAHLPARGDALPTESCSNSEYLRAARGCASRNAADEDLAPYGVSAIWTSDSAMTSPI